MEAQHLPHTRPTALVTGASGGIGADIARLLAERGYDLVLVARSHDKLAEVARSVEPFGAKVTIVGVDLSDPKAPDAVANAVTEANLTIDVLVNNAGLGSYGAFADIDSATDLGLIAVNITALTHLTKLFLPGMVARRRGRILNVASTAGYVPGPFMAVYYASKAYVLSLSVAIGDEVQEHGVTVTCLCPGPTRTGFDKRAGNDKSKLFARSDVMDSMSVARTGVDAMLRGQRIAVPGAMNWLMASTSGLLPRTLLARIAKGYQTPAA